MATYAQVSGVDALRLVNMIIEAAKHATTHRKNCEQLAKHVKIIGNFLEKLKSTDLSLRSLPATAEPFDELEKALTKALNLVESCKDKSYLYMLAVGWGVVYQFRQVQAEIDRYLSLLPLVSLVHQYRMQDLKEKLKEIEEDKPEFTLDEEEMAAQSVILNPARSTKDASVLETSLSSRYPDLKFEEALREEKKILQTQLQQLQRMQTNDDIDAQHPRLIHHLIDVADNVVNLLPEKKLHPNALIATGYAAWKPENQGQTEWQADLFDCCSEPCLSLKTCLYPCGTFQWIAHLVSQGKISRERACYDLSTYGLFCGCCCYTGCVRRKLRNHFNIEGGVCDDFLTHLMCFCCAMVQEWRELELRGFEGCPARKMIPPPYQYMKP
ncbi:hypothetical protein Ancab_034518 [Ancistrocladus abbreviatus]